MKYDYLHYDIMTRSQTALLSGSEGSGVQRRSSVAWFWEPEPKGQGVTRAPRSPPAIPTRRVLLSPPGGSCYPLQFWSRHCQGPRCMAKRCTPSGTVILLGGG